MTIFGKAGKAYNNFKYRLLKLNKFEQLEKLTKIQLRNTKRDECTLLKGWTPYINESELANKFVLYHKK